MWKRKAVIVAAAAAAFIFTNSGIANAEGENIGWTYTTDDNPGGSAQFTAYGDVLTVCDDQADGYGAWAELFNSSNGFEEEVIDSDGAGSCKSVANSSSVPEGIGVRLEVCLYKDGLYNYYCRYSTWGVS